MSGFVLTRTALRVIRNLAGSVDKAVIAKAVGCSVAKLEDLCRNHCISLKRDVEEKPGPR